MSKPEQAVVEQFEEWMEKHPESSFAVGAVQAMHTVISSTDFSAGSELQHILQKMTHTLKELHPKSLSLANACIIYTRFISRVDWNGTIEEIQSQVVASSKTICDSALLASGTIASWVNKFLRDDHVILVHGYCKVVASSLLSAARDGRRFRVLITECRPECSGYDFAKVLKDEGIPVSLVVDASVAHMMPTVDIILVGSEAVVENGGIINTLGTYQLGIVAKAFNKPFYVLAESYKFKRDFLFHQRDIQKNDPNTPLAIVDGCKSSDCVSPDEFVHHSWDYTPPEFITLLFTDIGILPSSAVSDELFKLYY